MRRIDLNGKRFGQLTVLRFVGIESDFWPTGSAAVWECRCSCGNVVLGRSDHLRYGKLLRCKACRRVDLLGKQFGRLTVVAPAGRAKNRVATKARWLCRCECGKEVVTRTDYLRSGRSTSCGCWLNGSRLPNKGAAWNQVLQKLKNQANTRNIEWALTREEVFDLVRRPCQYCGAPPSHPRTTHRDRVLWTGIDRVDSSKGYVPGNVVPACKWCNLAKNTMSYQEFRAWVRKIYRHMFGRKQERAAEQPQLSLLPD